MIKQAKYQRMSQLEYLPNSDASPLTGRYRGRFAPSPTGPLHLGSLAAAMAGWLDARAHQGEWLVRIEDIDPPREVAGATENILATLTDFGFEWSGEVMVQSQRGAAYQAAFDRLEQAGWLYPCACTRKEISDSITASTTTSNAAVYPGTCRSGLPEGRPPRAWRMRVAHTNDSGNVIRFDDRHFGPQQQNLTTEVGDYVLKRADGFWAYQLAVVVDDAEQGITDVVRGSDLLDSTPRQIHLQRALGLPTPRYLHVPVVETKLGEKLSKQTGAKALDRKHPLAELRLAAQHLGLEAFGATSITQFWSQATASWQKRNVKY